MDLTGKVSLVTGAATGIGRATAELLARRGAAVVIADIDDERGREAAARLVDAGGSAAFVHADVSDERAAAALVEAAEDRFGGLDIAVNNAGILGDFQPFREIPVEQYDRIMAVNARGVFLGMRAQIPAMIRRGGGAIVNVGSAAGTLVQPFAGAYSASKHAVHGLTKAAALDHARDGVRINAVAPGGVDTEMTAGLGPAPTEDPHPIGRGSEPDEQARAIVWLCSDEASDVVGAIVAVDGGLTLKLG